MTGQHGARCKLMVQRTTRLWGVDCESRRLSLRDFGPNRTGAVDVYREYVPKRPPTRLHSHEVAWYRGARERTAP
jgi:hypothetical protein